MHPSRPASPLVLCILDGWGAAPPGPGNAIASARTPVWRRMTAAAPHSLLRTSGEAVGLPPGQMGNSEVGHMTMGAGRVVMQDLPRIDRAIADGSLAGHATLRRLARSCRDGSGRCHLLGLVSPGGVHSHQDHLAALANILADDGVAVMLHAFLDGRDTPPSSARRHLARFRAQAPRAAIATVCGRYWAMDRDRRWDRTARAHAAIAAGRGERASDADRAIADAHEAGTGDEFVPPTAIGRYDGMAKGDGLLMANFRADRARQILTALLEPGFDGFERASRIAPVAAAGMVSYSASLDRSMTPLFKPPDAGRTLGRLVAEAGLRQLRVAETEKYAHVTYFLDGGEERAFRGEERILVPSPPVATYDLKPEMSAFEVTARLVEAIRGGGFEVIVCNLANADMVGHTGRFEAALKAVETVDHCLGEIARAVEDSPRGVLAVTADHGNIECMIDPGTGEVHTAHTTNPVPLVVAGAGDGARLRHGGLSDLAPTLLALLGLPRPREMTGGSLLATAGDGARGGAGTAPAPGTAPPAGSGHAG